MIQVQAPPARGSGLGAWLLAIRETLLSLGAQIADLQHRAAVVSAEAGRQGDAQLQGIARDSVVALGALRLAWGSVRDKYDELADMVPGLGALIVPLAYAAVAVAVAGAAYGIFRRYNAQERIVELLEAGQITPAEAAALMDEAGSSPLVAGGFGALGGAGLAVAFVIYLAMMRGKGR